MRVVTPILGLSPQRIGLCTETVHFGTARGAQFAGRKLEGSWFTPKCSKGILEQADASAAHTPQKEDSNPSRGRGFLPTRNLRHYYYDDNCFHSRISA